MGKVLVGVLLVLVVASGGMVSAISSEPVYIKGPQQIQAFRERLEKLQTLVQANEDLFAGHADFTSVLGDEVSRFSAFKPSEDVGTIEVTKLYRRLDAIGKGMGTKKTAATTNVQSAIRSQLDWIEQQNNLKGLVRGW